MTTKRHMVVMIDVSADIDIVWDADTSNSVRALPDTYDKDNYTALAVFIHRAFLNNPHLTINEIQISPTTGTQTKGEEQ